MTDLKALARERLRNLLLGEAAREEVVAEIADHLEFAFEEYRAKGFSDDAALAMALSLLGDCQKLVRGVQKERGNAMNDRFRRMWLPATVVGFLAYASEMVIFRFITWPHTVRVFGNEYAYSWGWLLVVACLGALGAWWSRAMGGSVRERLIVALAPAEIMVAVVAIVLPAGIAIESYRAHGVPYFLRHPEVMISVILWMLHCAVPALVGATPFLFASKASKNTVRIAG